MIKPATKPAPKRRATPAPAPARARMGNTGTPTQESLAGLSASERSDVLKVMSSEIVGRANLASAMGKTFGGERDLYKAAGYPLTITFKQYAARFERQGIGASVTRAFPVATWARPPDVRQDESDDKTEFEKAWDALVIGQRVWHYLNRIDILSGIGKYGALFLGFDDGQEFNKEVSNPSQLAYMQPYTEAQAIVGTLETDRKNPRYNLPKTYNVTMGDENDLVGKSGKTMIVHHSRILHVAEGLMTSNVYGTPRMRAIYNRLQNIDTIMAGSGEMFWKAGWPGWTFTVDADTEMGEQTAAAIHDEMQAYFHKLQRYIRLQGMKAEALTQQIADPTGHLMAELRLISSYTGVPMRILIGSEQAKLASTQDDTTWNTRVMARRSSYAEPMLLRPYINHLMQYGALPQVDEYMVDWPDLQTKTDQEEANVAKTRTETLAAYVKAPGAEAIIPPFQFLTEVLGYDEDKATAMLTEGAAFVVDVENQPGAEDDGDDGDDEEDL